MVITGKEGPSLRKSTVSGVLNAGTSMLVQLASQLFGLALLARILTPADFGTSAPSLAIAGFLALIAEFGLGANLVQKSEIIKEDIAAAIFFSLVLASGLSLFVLTFIYPISQLIALNNPSILAASLLTVFITPVAIILENVCLKKFNFRAVLVASILGSILGNLIVPVALALCGAGVWSIISLQVLVPLVKILAFLSDSDLRLLPRWSNVAMAKMIHFSSYFTVTKVLSLISLQGDRVIMAHALSANELGYYTRAQNFSQLVITFLTSAFEKVAFPTLASLQNDMLRTRRIYMEIFFLVSTFTGLASVIAASISHTLMVILLGKQWAAAAPLASIFSAMIFLRCNDRLAAILLRSHAMMKERTLLQAFLAIGTIGSCLLFARSGVIVIAWSIVICNAIGFFYTQAVVAKFLNLSLATYLKTFLRGGLIAGVYTGAFSLLSIIPVQTRVELWQLLQAFLSGSMTAGVVWLFRKRLLSALTLQMIEGAFMRFRRQGIIKI